MSVLFLTEIDFLLHNCIEFEIAGLAVRLVAECEKDITSFSTWEWGDSFQPSRFLVNNISNVDLSVYVDCTQQPEVILGKPIIDLMGGVSWYNQSAGPVLQSHVSPDNCATWSVRFSPDYHFATISSIFACTLSFELLPEIIWQVLLNRITSGALGACFHSCGLIDDGAGYLFIGRSGVGKSTSARIWGADEQVRVLSDERIVVRRINGEFRLYGTPWHSKARLCQPGSAPLKGVFFLQHGKQNECAPLGPAETVANLFSSGYPTHHNPVGMANTLDFLESMAGNLPHYRLSFLPDASVVDYVRNFMREKHG